MFIARAAHYCQGDGDRAIFESFLINHDEALSRYYSKPDGILIVVLDLLL